MSIKIHHGPPGSYKTAGAMQDDAVPAARGGRHIVLNVRGTGNEERWHTVLGNLPEEFEVTHVDTSTHAGRELMRRWFHWAPLGALIVLDEINTIYTKGWSIRDLAEYDYPGGLDAAERDGRPCNVLEAFEMHRHYNWDVVGTSPSWNKVHPALQDCAEGGYRHHNRKLIGLSGYLEIFHLADNAGRAKTDEIMVTKKTIERRTFDLYKSTTTGVVKDTTAGQNVFLRAGPIFVLAIIVALISGLVYVGPPRALAMAFLEDGTAGDGSGAVASQGKGAGGEGGAVAGSQSGFSFSGQVNPVHQGKHWLDEYDSVYFVGEIAGRRLVYVGKDDDGGITYTDGELRQLEVQVHPIGRCSARLWYAGHARLVHCRPGERGHDGGVVDRIREQVTG